MKRRYMILLPAGYRRRVVMIAHIAKHCLQEEHTETASVFCRENEARVIPVFEASTGASRRESSSRRCIIGIVKLSSSAAPSRAAGRASYISATFIRRRRRGIACRHELLSSATMVIGAGVI